MSRLIEVRTKLQNKIRRATPAEKETLREEKAGVTARIMELRKQLKMNRAIEKCSVKIQENHIISEMLLDPVCKCGFTGTRTSGNPDNDTFHCFDYL